MRRKWILGLSVAALLAPAAAAAAAGPSPAPQAAPAAAPADAAETQRLHALFDARWEARMQDRPEWATYSGDHRYGDRWSDESPGAIAARYAATRQVLAQARAMRRPLLSATDRVSLDLFIYELEEALRLEPYVGFRSMSLGAQGGFQSQLAELLQVVPVTRPQEVEQLLARLVAYPRRVEQELALLRQGLALGWVPSRNVVERVRQQLDRQLAAPVDTGPFFEPFTRLGSGMPAAQQAALKARGQAAVTGQVLPALRRLRDFVAGDYLGAAPADGALSRYPGGSEVYTELVRSNTTTELTPAQIHAIGLREMARLRAEMDAVIAGLKFEGSFAAFVQHINTDPRFFLPSSQALLAGYRDIAKRIDPELPKLFAELPRAPYGVRAMPPHFSAETAEFYSGPALDGSRPGWFNANARAWQTRPTWGMETLVAHEAVPGHHLQIARAVELGGLPRFRRNAGYNAYAEGWAVYAETLGFELGLYQDPYSRFGHLQWQAFRAGRLVVDTGIHALGWSRQQAIDYMVERTGEKRDFITAEIDRYTSWPAQALGYMIGKLKIVELRDRAQARLGERFDIRQFHDVVLGQGSVPLPVLEQAVDAWVQGVPAR